MTIKQAGDYIPDFECFEMEMCNNCTTPDGYCLCNCYELEKAKQIGYNRLIRVYAEYDDDFSKVIDFIRRARFING
ncbi:MAG: hypothetical protein LUD27_01855 [Clostridia bacterium]|nr:hypothetical protein [Clostridia bacterium]